MKRSTGSSTAPDMFLDTSGFYSLLVHGDRKHAQAANIMASRKPCGPPGDYVVAESATLLMVRGKGHLAEEFFRRVLASRACRLEWMDPSRFETTRRFFVKHLDQHWSFTDCFSFDVMRALNLHDALSSDEHFRHAGF